MRLFRPFLRGLVMGCLALTALAAWAQRPANSGNQVGTESPVERVQALEDRLDATLQPAAGSNAIRSIDRLPIHFIFLIDTSQAKDTDGYREFYAQLIKSFLQNRLDFELTHEVPENESQRYSIYAYQLGLYDAPKNWQGFDGSTQSYVPINGNTLRRPDLADLKIPTDQIPVNPGDDSPYRGGKLHRISRDTLFQKLRSDPSLNVVVQFTVSQTDDPGPESGNGSTGPGFSRGEVREGFRQDSELEWPIAKGKARAYTWISVPDPLPSVKPRTYSADPTPEKQDWTWIGYVLGAVALIGIGIFAVRTAGGGKNRRRGKAGVVMVGEERRLIQPGQPLLLTTEYDEPKNDKTVVLTKQEGGSLGYAKIADLYWEPSKKALTVKCRPGVTLDGFSRHGYDSTTVPIGQEGRIRFTKEEYSTDEISFSVRFDG